MLLVRTLFLLLLVAAATAFLGLEKVFSPSGRSNKKGDTSSSSEKKSPGIFDKIVETAKNTTEKVVDAVTPDVNGTTFNTFKALFTTVDSCIGDGQKGWDDPELGNFSVGPDSPYCNGACSRNFFCCAPQKPEDLTVNFFFSGKRGQHVELKLNDDKSRNLVKKSRKLVWVVHGFGNDITASDDIYNKTRDSYLERGYGVVLVDWHKGNRLYNQAMANVRIVGALLGQLMVNLGVTKDSMCAGFSLGSHVCGEAGSWVKRQGQKIPKCIGVDPAGPGFDGCSNAVRLDKKDCALVVSIHTSQFKGIVSIATEDGFGTKVKTGHCDFWANTGKEQPKCDNNTVGAFSKNLVTGQLGKIGSDLSYSISCSHSRGMQYFFSQVSEACNFVGKRAECGGGSACVHSDTEDDETENGAPIPDQMSLPPDDKCTTSFDVDYTFDTTAKEPFC